MLAVAVMAVAASTYAGAASWAVSNIYLQNDSANKAAAGAYEGFFFFSGDANFVEASALQTYLSDTTKTAAQKLAYLDEHSYKSSGTTGSGRISGVSVDFASYPDSDATAEPPVAYTGYSVIIDGWTTADQASGKVLATHAVIGSVSEVKVTSVGSSQINAFNASTLTKGDWISLAGTTPEPTSGLLLLLGVASLALRRRRA